MDMEAYRARHADYLDKLRRLKKGDRFIVVDVSHDEITRYVSYTVTRTTATSIFATCYAGTTENRFRVDDGKEYGKHDKWNFKDSIEFDEDGKYRLMYGRQRSEHRLKQILLDLANDTDKLYKRMADSELKLWINDIGALVSNLKARKDET